MPKEQIIMIMLDGKKVGVSISDYVAAKTKDLQEFGYTNLTEEEVYASVKKVLKGKPLSNVIDYFINDNIILNHE